MLRLAKYHWIETALNWISIILLCIVSVACSAPDNSLQISTSATRTTAGGNPISLTVERAGTVNWSIDPQCPGSLDSAVGDTIHYLPPAAGSIAQESAIKVTATANGISTTVAITLAPSLRFPMSASVASNANAGIGAPVGG